MTAQDPGSRLTDDALGAAGAIGRALFVAWRRVVTATAKGATHVAASARTLARSWTAQWLGLRDYHLAAAEPWAPETDAARRSAVAIGLRALVFGLVLGGAVAASASGLAGIMVILTEALWAAVRFIIIALLVPPGSIDRSRLSDAYLAGLLPYAGGVTPVLRVAALLASAALTARGLEGAGLQRKEAAVVTAWAFGGQLGVLAFGWAIRAVIALVVGV